MSQQFRTRIVTVDAVQWTGENILDVQTLLAPSSPLWNRDQKSTHIGVMVDKAPRSTYDATHELQHADANDWIVKYPSGRVAIVKQAHFEEYFESVGKEGRELSIEEAALALGNAAGALAVGDRQPALEADEATVSER